jgi:hypothetical protein
MGHHRVRAGGKTSTLTQFTELAARAGLEVVAAGPQPVGYVVECIPEFSSGRNGAG